MNIEISSMDPNSDGAKLAAEFAKERKYPKDYKGPKAGKSDNKEWIAVRDYDAFCYIKDGTWSYSDFDCYLYSMCEDFSLRGRDSILNAFEEMQKITGVHKK